MFSPKSEKEAWCSWCYKLTQHNVAVKSIIPGRRNAFVCSQCTGRTLGCRFMGCQAMARGHGDWDAELCAVHDKTIKEWGELPPDEEVEGWCSWCFSKTKHQPRQKNTLRRTVFECRTCMRRTLKCRFCKEAFSRGHDGAYDDERCAKCRKVIQDWNDAEAIAASTKVVRWCSWCFENGHHTLERTHTLGRHEYTCDLCHGCTLKCMKCNEGSARGGAGWDDKFCEGCSGNAWEMNKDRKDEMFNKNRERSKIDGELMRESRERTQAQDAGMIRPFLLLVSMDPALRNQIACQLGWSLIPEKHFGDSHAEAWDIINRTFKGITARATKSWELVGKKNTWYAIVFRVLKAIFPASKVERDPNGDAESWTTSEAKLLPNLEMELLAQVARVQLSRLSEEQKSELDRLMSNEEVRKMVDIMKANGVTDDDVIRASIHTTFSALEMGGNNNMSLTKSVAAAMQLQLTATKGAVSAAKYGTISSMAGSTALFATGLLVIGVLFVAVDIFSTAFGASLDRLCPPIVLILTHRVFMAAEGMTIENYY